MAEKSYWQLLKDPRWQRKRLEILERDKWECTVCEDRLSTLHVHHKVYRKGLKPWEAPSDDFTTVCEDCHEAYGEQQERLKDLVAKMSFGDVDHVIGYATALYEYTQGGNAIQINGPCDASGVASFFKVSFGDVMDMSTNGAVNPDALFDLATGRRS